MGCVLSPPPLVPFDVHPSGPRADAVLLQDSEKENVCDTSSIEGRCIAVENYASGALPSVGSVLHASGRCKPCGFLWKPQGCQYGAECQHCHSCSVAEKKNRKKEKRQRAMHV